jgi:hypothetical protein
MSVIRRIDVVNLLNHRKESTEWNPWYRHVTIPFYGYSGVLQLANGKGKTTIAEAISALLSREKNRLDVIQGRMAFRGCQLSHFRLELLKNSSVDLVGIGGEPWVLGMAGNNVGTLHFYTYQGTLEDVPVVKSITPDSLQLASLEEIERAVMAKPSGDRSWNSDASHWRNRLVGGRHVPRAVLQEISRLQGMGGAEKAVKFFDIKAKGERFDQAFFFDQIAPDLIDDLMTSEGEEEERRSLNRHGHRYQPDSTFDKMVVNTLRSVATTQYAIHDRSETLDKWRSVADGLEVASAHIDIVNQSKDTITAIRKDISANLQVWSWLRNNMPGWPSRETPGDLLGEVCCHMGMLANGTSVISDAGIAFLLGKDISATNQFIHIRKNIHPVAREDITNIVHCFTQRNFGDAIKIPSSRNATWYTVGAANQALSLATSFAHALTADTARALLSSATEWALSGYFETNPVARKVAEYTESLKRCKNMKLHYEDLIKSQEENTQKRVHETDGTVSSLNNHLSSLRVQMNDIKRFSEYFPGMAPDEVALERERHLGKVAARKEDLENQQSALKGELEALNRQQVICDHFADRVHKTLNSASIRFTTVLDEIENARDALEKARRWDVVIRLFANTLFAPVVETPKLGQRASLAVDNAGLSFPVFVRDRLLALFEDDEITEIPELKFAHMAWGGVETAKIRAITDATETQDFKVQILERLSDVNDKLAKLDDLAQIRRQCSLAEAAKRAIDEKVKDIYAETEKSFVEQNNELELQKNRLKAIHAILSNDEVPIPSELLDLKEEIQGYKSKAQELRQLKENFQAWGAAATHVHAIAARAQNGFQKAVQVQKEFAIDVDVGDLRDDHCVASALALKDAQREILKNGGNLQNQVSRLEANIFGLDVAELRLNLREAKSKSDYALSEMMRAVELALSGESGLTDLQRQSILDEAQTPDGLLRAAKRFRKEIDVSTEFNQRSQANAEELEGRAIEFLVSMVAEVRRRLRILEASLTDGEGAQFIVDCTLPQKDDLRKIFGKLLETVRRIDRETRAAKGPDASDDEIHMIADRALRKVVRENTKREILRDASVKVAHGAISGGESVYLQDPDPNNPKRFSGGENTAISLAWIIRRAKYAIEKVAMRSRLTSSAQSSFIILDGLFSDLSDEDLTKEAMAPLKTLGGQFQMIAFVHPPEYLLKHDPAIFPVLNLGRIHGDGWKIQHIDEKTWKEEYVVKEGSMGVTHLRILPVGAEGPSKQENEGSHP